MSKQSANIGALFYAECCFGSHLNRSLFLTMPHLRVLWTPLHPGYYPIIWNQKKNIANTMFFVCRLRLATVHDSMHNEHVVLLVFSNRNRSAPSLCVVLSVCIFLMLLRSVAQFSIFCTVGISFYARVFARTMRRWFVPYIAKQKKTSI